jgi:hypothetical protein
MVLIIFLVIAIVVVGNYQLIHSSSGFHVLKRKEWGFSHFYVNTTGWNALDYAKNPRISSELFSDGFQALYQDTREHIQTWWDDVAGNRNVPELKTIKKEFDMALEKLNQAYRDGKVTMKKYNKKLQELQKSTEKKVQEVLKTLKET